VRPIGLGTELVPIREAIADFKPHIAFNLLVHFQEIGYYDAHVISYLELAHLAYTGCNPRGLLIASDKALSKKVLAWHRVPVPAFAVFRRGRRVRRPKRLEFPLFVKSVNEHASQGIAQASIVNDDASLAERVEFIHRSIGTDAIAESYIEGRELTVGVIGNQRLVACPVWEMTFESLPAGSEPIATSRVKWDHDYQAKIGLKTGPAKDLPEDVASGIQRMAKRIFRALGLSGYARVDLRMDEAGQVYVLEANPNPDITFGEDFAEAAEKAGLDYPALIQRILNLGLRYAPAWKES
jgi:D-alanine-D-alanine ligase